MIQNHHKILSWRQLMIQISILKIIVCWFLERKVMIWRWIMKNQRKCRVAWILMSLKVLLKVEWIRKRIRRKRKNKELIGSELQSQTVKVVDHKFRQKVRMIRFRIWKWSLCKILKYLERAAVAQLLNLQNKYLNQKK